MGLIAARPEEPDEWAGIPSEPRDIEADVESLDQSPLAASDAFGLLGGGAIESIIIPVARQVEIAAEHDGTPSDGPPRD
jgi:hypothetical protein